jgi:Fe(3+) dicitrate transport protein
MKYFKLFLIFIVVNLAWQFSLGQDASLQVKELDSITLKSYLYLNNVKPLQAVQGTYIFAGKKTEVISLAQIPADVTNKTGRQVFAKIPGVFVYDMDGSGNQINIAARGLDPHRGWEFNNRKTALLPTQICMAIPPVILVCLLKVWKG